jgi:hypothetical protein
MRPLTMSRHLSIVRMSYTLHLRHESKNGICCDPPFVSHLVSLREISENTVKGLQVAASRKLDAFQNANLEHQTLEATMRDGTRNTG